MIESVVALLMFINGEIKEHVFKIIWLHAFEANVKQRELFLNLYLTNATRVRQKQRSYHGRKNIKALDIRMKIQAEIVNGICPTCEEYTPLVGITKQFFRCLTCGTDLEQKVNGA